MIFSPKAKRELSWILLFTSCLTLMYILVFGDGGFVQVRKYRAELQDLQLENLRLRKKHRDYLERIDRLKTDAYEIERIARERYNFARPGDIIVNLQE
ncbi:septum formation initiator family protein [Acidobacteria bacterium AH-259-G07]|nr:septum formation initiator family protein [Acidobacteria bacterium AH-259-G07]